MRATAILAAKLERNLLAYATAATAAGVSVLTMARVAESKVIYTPAHQKLPLNQDSLLDLNHDGTDDFRFHILTSDINLRPGTYGTQDSAFLWIYPQASGNQVIGQAPYAYALQAGIRVGPKKPFVNGRGSLGGVVGTAFAGRYFGPWAASGNAVNHRYLGLQFVIDGEIHFGWARLNVRIYRDPEATVDAVLTGYAYETVADKPIIAGNRGSTTGQGPDAESVSLGHLALGAARRRPKPGASH